MSAFSNQEYEFFAALSISCVLPDFTKNLKKGESPDWWNEKNSIGIEVARAENKHIGFTTHLANTYLGKTCTEIPENQLESFLGEALFSEDGKLFGVSDSKGFVDGNRHIQLAIETAERKLDLLNTEHFRTFDKNCLYLFMTFSMRDGDNGEFLQKYGELAKKYGNRYSHVFLWAFDALTHIDVDCGQITKFPFSDKQVAEMDSITHVLQSASDWKNGTDFHNVLNQKHKDDLTLTYNGEAP